jgi:hypothetical protein
MTPSKSSKTVARLAVLADDGGRLPVAPTAKDILDGAVNCCQPREMIW